MVGNFAVGLSGHARAGKTAAALYLQEAYGFNRCHIAEPMRAMLAVLMRANGIENTMIDRYLTGDLKNGVPIPELGGRTSRELQISIGSKWGRACVSSDLWVNTWRRMVGDRGRVMNDSVRFPNEEQAIHDLGGITILIRRPGTGPIAFRWGPVGRFLYERFGLMHGVDVSERTDRLDPDAIIDNDGTLEDLYRDLDAVMAAHDILKISDIAAIEAGVIASAS